MADWDEMTRDVPARDLVPGDIIVIHEDTVTVTGVSIERDLFGGDEYEDVAEITVDGHSYNLRFRMLADDTIEFIDDSPRYVGAARGYSDMPECELAHTG